MTLQNIQQNLAPRPNLKPGLTFDMERLCKCNTILMEYNDDVKRECNAPAQKPLRTCSLIPWK